MRTALVGIVALAVIVGGCAGPTPSSSPGPGATAAPSILPSASSVATPTVVPTVAPTPSAVTSTTVASSSAPQGAVPVAFMGPPPRFGPANLTVKASDLVFYLSNTSHAAHNVAIGAKVSGSAFAISRLVEVGTSAVYTVRGLTPGTYAFWCTISDHAAAGMFGSLTVN